MVELVGEESMVVSSRGVTDVRSLVVLSLHRSAVSVQRSPETALLIYP